MKTKIGNLKLHLSILNGFKDFEITSLFQPSHSTRYGYLLMDGLPFVSVEMYQDQLVEGQQEKAQFAANSLVSNTGAYNALLVAESQRPEQVMTFSKDLLDHADAEVFDMFGKPHIYIESKSTAPKPFRFNIWHHDIMDDVYNAVIRPKVIGVKPSSFEEYYREYC